MKKILLYIFFIVFVSTLWILNLQSGAAQIVEPHIALKHIGSIDNLIVKVKEAKFSDVGYKRLMFVLDKISSTEGMSVYKSEETTTALDSFKGNRRLELFVFRGENPFMKVEVVGDSPSNLEVVFATLVISQS